MYDVAIIGGGVSGCSLLFELSRYQVKAVILEKENDVAAVNTKANTAIVHAGYDPHPGTLMAKYNVWGNEIIPKLCEDLDIHYIKNGSLVVGFDEADSKLIDDLYERGQKNGVPDLYILDSEKIHELEPNLNPEINKALYAPNAGIISPWELGFAMAEAAVEAGAEVLTNAEVSAIEKTGDYFTLKTSVGEIKARFVVNAAGVYADKISQMIEPPFFKIVPNRGEYYIMDVNAGDTVKNTIFPCPTKFGKGILVAPTVHGNLIVGPNSEDVDGNDISTTAEGQEYVRKFALRSVPGLNFRDSIRNFAGVRCPADIKDDFIIGESETVPGFYNIAGIKSPGLTSAPAVAIDMVKAFAEKGLELIPNPKFTGKRSVVRIDELSNEERAKKVKENPLYGKVVCRCRTITEGEIVDALKRPLPPVSVDAVKRRVMAGSGRCQGGFCGPRVQAIIARELGIPKKDVPLDRVGMDIIIGETKVNEGAL